MKRVFAVTLLLMSFVSLALADGSGMPPPPVTKPPKPEVVVLADGSGMPPPPATPRKPALVGLAA
jgi:hypothetical protein